MRQAPLLTLLGIAIWCAAPAVQALGIGRTANSSTLGQPLNLVAAVQLDGDEVLTPRCITATVMAGDAPVRTDRVRVWIESGSDARQRRVRIATTSPIAEPLVTVKLTVGCQSRVTRSFVTLINPPTTAPSEPMELEQPAVRDAESHVAAVPASGESRADAPRYVRNAHGRWVRQGTVASATPVPVSAKTPVPVPTAGAGPATVVAASPGPAASSTIVATTTLLPETTTAGSPTPLEAKTASLSKRIDVALGTKPGLPEAAAPVVASQRTARTGNNAVATAEPSLAAADHVRELEAGLATLRNDSARGQQSVAALQARLHEVEAERGLNPLVGVLGGVALLLVGAVVAMWKWMPSKRITLPGRASDRTSKRSTRKSAARGEIPVLRDRAVLGKDDAAALERLIEPAAEPIETLRAAPLDDASLGGLEVTQVLDPAMHARVKRSSRADGSFSPSTFGRLEAADTRGTGPSMEELVDVEQQAEFYLVMGQDEAAIALLDKHIANGGGSPMPFLKLLEIHQRRRDEAPYNAVRQHFNERFKAYAPEWTGSLELGRTLDEYPATLESVQSAWAAPIHAMKMLDGLLFRRSANEDAFDFAAYRELLFLYSIARDLSGDVKPAMGADVDLVLPLDEESIALLSRRMKAVLPTVSANASRMGDVDVDLDIFAAPVEGDALGASFTQSMTGTR